MKKNKLSREEKSLLTWLLIMLLFGTPSIILSMTTPFEKVSYLQLFLLLAECVICGSFSRVLRQLDNRKWTAYLTIYFLIVINVALFFVLGFPAVIFGPLIFLSAFKIGPLRNILANKNKKIAKSVQMYRPGPPEPVEMRVIRN